MQVATLLFKTVEWPQANHVAPSLKRSRSKNDMAKRTCLGKYGLHIMLALVSIPISSSMAMVCLVGVRGGQGWMQGASASTQWAQVEGCRENPFRL
jgi:hypothetical protein